MPVFKKKLLLFTEFDCKVTLCIKVDHESVADKYYFEAENLKYMYQDLTQVLAFLDPDNEDCGDHCESCEVYNYDLGTLCESCEETAQYGTANEQAAAWYKDNV